MMRDGFRRRPDFILPAGPGELRRARRRPAGALFFAGVAGSLVHCAGMCGPFVLGQVMVDAGRRPGASYGNGGVSPALRWRPTISGG